MKVWEKDICKRPEFAELRIVNSSVGCNPGQQ